MTALAERDALRLSFPIAEARFAWGTLFDEAAARYAPARVGTGGFLDVPCASVLGLGTIGATVYAPPRARPIHQLSYAIGEDAALHTEDGASSPARRCGFTTTDPSNIELVLDRVRPRKAPGTRTSRPRRERPC